MNAGHHQPRTRRVALGLAALLALAACSGSNGDGRDAGDATSTSASKPASDPDNTIHVGTGATSNISIDASTDGRTVAVAWYERDDDTGNERVLVTTSTDGGSTYGTPVVVDEPSVEYPSVEVNDDGTILLGAVHYDLESFVDPSDGQSWPSWPVLFRSTNRGRSFTKLRELDDLVAKRLITGDQAPNMAASDDGRTITIAWHDRTPEKFVPAGEPTLDVDGAARPVFITVSRDGGTTFSKPVAAAPSTCGCCRVRSFVAGSRVGVATRLVQPRDADHDERDPGVTLVASDGTVGAPVEIHDDGYVLPLDGCPASGPGIDGDDRILHAAWWTGTDARGSWWYATAEGGTAFGPPVRLPGTGAQAYSVEVAVDGAGEAWIIGQRLDDMFLWRSGNGSPTAIEDRPRSVTRTTTSQDIAALPQGALVAWVFDGTVKVARYT